LGRGLASCLATAVGFAAVLWLLAWLLMPELDDRPAAVAPEAAQAAHAARQVTFDPHQLTSLHRRDPVTPSNESPLLADLVGEGKLPPLAQRLPREPIVMQGPDGIGRYGGTWLRVANAVGDIGIISNRMSCAYLVRWSPLGYPIEPHIARSVAASADFRVWTVHLRPGLKWSDGHPYTADDIVYWWEQEILNPAVSGTVPDWMMTAGKPGRVERVDDFQVRFVFPDPYPLFLERLAQFWQPCDTPRHYLQPYHPDPAVGDTQRIAAQMQAYGMPSARSLYAFIKQPFNPEHPRLWSWIYRTYKSTPPQVFVRNPYYAVVDPAGNQLPYLDRVQFDVQDAKVLSLTIANGGVSMQTRHLRFSDYTELMSRRQIAGTRVLHWYPATRSVFVINPNLNRRIDPQRPATRWKTQLLADRRFRQAMSLAINRQRIIDAENSGVGRPSQVAPGPESPFHDEASALAFTQHDPAQAARLLDELGLTHRDYEGYRTFPDRTRMTFFLDYTSFTGGGPAQFVVEDWHAAGVRVIPRERSRALFYAEKDGMEFDFNVWTGESDLMPTLLPRYFIPMNTESFYAVGWGKWYQRGGFFGNDKANGFGCIPVPTDHPMYEAITHFEAARQATTLPQQQDLMRRVLRIAAENVWSINIATAPPQLVVVAQGFRNVPENALYGVIYSTPGNAGIETYFYENPVDSPGAQADLKRALLQPTPRPGATRHGADASGGRWIALLLRGAMIVIALGLVVLVVVRHPFVARRLILMIPTLLIISVISFVIIQLPPGDFLSTRIMQLEQSGEASDLAAIEDLRRMFHYDDSALQRYARWMGLYWFGTFERADLGLLQGHLGRSMETTQPVNQMVGDRLLLTVLMSLGTIVLTWALAIPIGIYSAVRQYSLADYVLTLVGFVGMCVPAFLLALVLMAVSGVSGLFSPQFAAQPEWTMGKAIDLMQHIWIPIVVLGVGGTASMIRVMRANLLDELRKPYVVTATAKGVRPLKLLLKYPVRVAINPFVSGIGSLFPQLVSGGAIVSIVLALPTVGPLLIDALFSEDMYLAGSMLMVLSILGVAGTLVSDLLLLALDPRIRFQGGTR
jgi:ABC-type dipeptide/oligopeptide/nickel transport system permease component/ABC-type transport system substrate-binding protein